jgi:NAD(P)-dependent dehydrogenase (short-subunit alcohol dehydrogenase family)
MAGEMGLGGRSDYAATKGGVHAMTRDLAVELGPDHINVNAIASGFMQTAMTRPFISNPDDLASFKTRIPWPELGTASDVASAVAFLASDDAAFVTGTTIVVDGGQSAG